MNIIEVLAKEFGLKQSQVEQTVNLIDEGNTIPFIARYRKKRPADFPTWCSVIWTNG